MHIDAEIAFHAAVAAIWIGMALSTLRDVLAVPSLESAAELGCASRREGTSRTADARASDSPVRDAQELSSSSGMTRREHIPAVSVVVPVRDEAARIGGVLSRLRAQVGVELEVIVVDDRSQDATGEIALAAARADARIHVVRVDTLPDGWLGKPHACQRGAEIAQHPWILFTDGDIEMAPDVLARAVALAERERADHLVLAPGCPQRTFAANVVVNAFAALMLRDLARANRDARNHAVGIGAFNLVRKSAWHAIGEHKSLAFEVVDDMRLGLLLARAGFRTRARIALHDVRAEWGGTVQGLIAALDKNMFAHMGYSVPLALLSAVFMAALWLAAITAPLFMTLAGWIAFAAFLASGLVGAVSARRQREPILPALLAPFGFGVIPIVILVSMTRTLRQGGVRWRGRLYPLSELRARRVQ
jgi:hypothetical protein